MKLGDVVLAEENGWMAPTLAFISYIEFDHIFLRRCEFHCIFLEDVYYVCNPSELIYSAGESYPFHRYELTKLEVKQLCI